MRKALLSAALLLAACSDKKAEQAYDSLRADALYKETGALLTDPACSNILPMEYGQMLPVPAKENGRFQVAYYPPRDRLKTFKATPPQFGAEYSIDGKKKPVCKELQRANDDDLGPAVRDDVSRAEYLEAVKAYYAGLPAVAADWSAGKPLTPEAKKRASDLLARFLVASEPGLRPFYYRSNPAFWEWLRKETGSSIPKA